MRGEKTRFRKAHMQILERFNTNEWTLLRMQANEICHVTIFTSKIWLGLKASCCGTTNKIKKTQQKWQNVITGVQLFFC